MNNNNIRQIALDTETTGINEIGLHYEGHKIIEIGAIEIINRNLTGNKFHTYLNPNRSITSKAFYIHGINNKFLQDKPLFSNIIDDFICFIKNSELIIHNASFDIGFINYEIKMLNRNIKKINELCKITDSLRIAQKIFPGKKNNLDILSKRYCIKSEKRTLHSALLDAKILAKVFLHMTGGQINFIDDYEINKYEEKFIKNVNIDKINLRLNTIYASNEEILAHKKILNLISKKSNNCLWNNFKN